MTEAAKQMEKHYDPHAIEQTWYARWLERGVFHGDSAKGGEPYTIMIPPPNVTGVLHMGHALNGTIQDVVARHRRMNGFAKWPECSTIRPMPSHTRRCTRSTTSSRTSSCAM